jgi:predicted naringenin-chalcone synthase
MVMAVAVDDVTTNAATLEYWFCVAPDPGVMTRTMDPDAGVVSMFPLTPPVAVLPVLMVVCAVAAAAMAVLTQPMAGPNRLSRILGSAYGDKGVSVQRDVV